MKKRAVKSFYFRPKGKRRAARAARSRSAKPAAPETAITRRIPTAAIDWSYTLRAINVEHIERLAGASQLPPIAVWEWKLGHYRGVDGYHRWRLALDRGDKVVHAAVHRFPGGAAGEKAFELEAVRSNLRHGLPLSRDERDRAIVRLWRRWGRTGERSEGYTLEELGRLFNLTKQRVHQILFADQSFQPDSRRAQGAPPATGVVPIGERLKAPGRYSTFGRFSAATRRLRGLLRDVQFMTGLLKKDGGEAFGQLRELRALIDEALESASR